jgi:hypothetical protein
VSPRIGLDVLKQKKLIAGFDSSAIWLAAYLLYHLSYFASYKKIVAVVFVNFTTLKISAPPVINVI